MVTVLLFAMFRELVGRSSLTIPVEDPMTVEDVFERLLRRYPDLSSHRPLVLASVNEEYAHWDTKIRAGDEVGFFPPVSGGTA